MDEVDFTILAATSVFTDLSEKCPPAEACREAIDRTARATIRMANSTGGFGQVLPSKRAGSRESRDRRDWAARSDSASVKSGHRHHRQRHSGEQQHGQQPGPTQFGLPGISDAYANVSSGSQLPPIQSSAPYRMGSLPNLKAEQDGFSLMRSLPAQARSHASAPGGGGGSPDTSAIDPSLLPSPSAAVRTPPAGSGMGSPSSSKMAGGSRGGAGGQQQLPPGTSAAQMAAYIAHTQAQQQAAATATSFSPGGGSGHMSFGDLQGMDFLNQVGGGVPGTGMDEAAANGDFGFGLGWEGLHHDFSDGQQYDLFDGFFFGGQQGGAGSNGVL